MKHSKLTTNLIVFSALPLVLNSISFIPILIKYHSKPKGKTIGSNPSLQPLIWLLIIDILMALQLVFPIHNFLVEKGSFTELTCFFYGAADMALSLIEVLLACIIGFDRYIVTIAPKWGKWRCHSNYFKLISFCVIAVSLWSTVPYAGYGKYSTFHHDMFCSIDWRQGNIDQSEESRRSAHRYIAFLTATCLVFFLIPVCIASSLYYSIIDHVDKQNSLETRDDTPNSTQQEICSWAPRNHVAKVGLGCLLVSVVPFFGYSIVCLNPMKSDFQHISHIVVPVVISRASILLNPIFYVWLNPEIVPINEFLAKRAKPRPQRQLYHTINLIAEVPGMSFPILTPTIPRRKLPQIPHHLTSMKPTSSSFAVDFVEDQNEEDEDGEMPKEYSPMLL